MQVQQQIGDTVVDSGSDGEIVNIYDTNASPVVIVRWHEDPDFGISVGFDDPHCEDFSPEDFYREGKNRRRVRSA